ncbi:glycosyltransferase [Bdellovibrio bacteriovorus]|uniref:glycosyltransferase n=1 Tax=Bdellovibrio bacteriovorus TaxID=959 RepID=UPI0035A67124
MQLLQTKKALEDRGMEIVLFDQWKPQKDVDIYHQFSIQYGTNYVMDAYKEKGVPVALSTILWANLSHDDAYFKQIFDLVSKADILLTNSDLESRKISKDFSIPLSKFFKTRNSLTSDFLDLGTGDLFRKRFCIDEDFILTVGNIDRRKNTRVLVEICKEMGLNLVVIGAVRDSAYFEEFKSISNKVYYTGPIYDPLLIRSAYRACRLFVLPSLCETPGLSALEAASQGARVVVTEEGAAREYLGEYALYVSPLSRESIATGIAEGLEMSVKHDQIDFVKGNYTWSRTGDDVMAGYSRICTT